MLIFPINTAGIKGGERYNTQVASSAGGFEQTVSLWQDPLRMYEVSAKDVKLADLDALTAFFNLVRGRGSTFLFQDPSDHKVTAETITNPHPAATVQLTKTYTQSAQTYSRRIRRPVNGSVTIERNTGSGWAAWSSGGNWSLDYTTGILTITTPTAGHQYRWTGNFYILCRMDTDDLPKKMTGWLQRGHESFNIVEVRDE